VRSLPLIRYRRRLAITSTPLSFIRTPVVSPPYLPRPGPIGGWPDRAARVPSGMLRVWRRVAGRDGHGRLLSLGVGFGELPGTICSVADWPQYPAGQRR